jgi:hypothetical protein
MAEQRLRRGVHVAHVAGATPPPPLPLTEAQLQTFVERGVLQLQPRELSPAVHRTIYDKCRVAWLSGSPARRSELTRDMFPELPELNEVVGCATLRGALTSLLGDGYVQHPHRTMHVRRAPDDPEGLRTGSDQDFHVDSYSHEPAAGSHHFPRWCIVFYYASDTTVEMGTTSLIPGAQYLHVDSPYQRISLHQQPAFGCWPAAPGSATSGLHGPDLQKRNALLARHVEAFDPGATEHKVVCEAGTFVLLHFSSWHRACRQLPHAPFRLMFKLMFMRTTAPRDFAAFAGATADLQASAWPVAGTSIGDAALWKGSFEYLLPSTKPRHALLSERQVVALEQQLFSAHCSERERVGAAYALGRATAAVAAAGEDGGTAARTLLLRCVQSRKDASLGRAASYGLAAAGDAMLPSLLQLLQQHETLPQEGVSPADGEYHQPVMVTRIAVAIGEGVLSTASACLALPALVKAATAMEQCLTAYLSSAAMAATLSSIREKASQGAEVGRNKRAEMPVSEVEDEGATRWRHALCTVLLAIGTVCERLVAPSPQLRTCTEEEVAAAAAVAARCLLRFATPREDRFSAVLEPTHANPHAITEVQAHRAGSMGTRAWSIVAPEQTEFWSRMTSALALLRLCSGACVWACRGKMLGAEVVSEETVSHHGDDRFAPAICNLAVQRAQHCCAGRKSICSQAGNAVAAAEAALDEIKRAGAEGIWAATVEDLAQRASEPWLHQAAATAGVGQGVQWRPPV